jgi:hypothetical protein
MVAMKLGHPDPRCAAALAVGLGLERSADWVGEEHHAQASIAFFLAGRSVFDSNDAVELDLETGLLSNLSPSTIDQRLAALDPTGRQVPATIAGFVHEHEAVMVSHDDECDGPSR